MLHRQPETDAGNLLSRSRNGRGVRRAKEYGGDCFDTEEGGVGTAEEIGLRLMRDLGIADGPDALANLRAKGPKEITAVPEHDRLSQLRHRKRHGRLGSA